MAKPKPEKTWYLDSGFELRIHKGHWGIFEGGKLLEYEYSLPDARKRAQELRKSRNEPK